MSEHWAIHTIKDLDPVITHLQSLLKEGDVVLLQGEVGVGKTTFINRFVSAVGGQGSNSPTFAIHNEYKTPKFKIQHLDLYRLETAEEIYSVGFDDFIQDQKTVTFIEWSERLTKSQLPRGRRLFELKITRKEDLREFFWRMI